MEPRLDFFKANPEAMRTMAVIEQHIAGSGLEEPLMEFVHLRTSQIDGCAYCLDVHTADARKGGESERRLATLGVWRETPFFTERSALNMRWSLSASSMSISGGMIETMAPPRLPG